MTWDGKRGEPAPVRAYVCAGCMKPGGTLARMAGKRSPLVHHRRPGCVGQAITRLRQSQEQAEVSA